MDNINKKRPKPSEPDAVFFHNTMQANNNYDPKYCILLTDHISKGFSLNSFDVGVSSATIYEWLRNHKDFALARELGERRKLKLLEAAGMKMAVSDGNASVWKVLMSQYGVTEKTESIHHHSHSHTSQTESAEPIKLTGHQERLARIRELSQRLGITDSQEDIVEAELEDEG